MLSSELYIYPYNCGKLIRTRSSKVKEENDYCDDSNSNNDDNQTYNDINYEQSGNVNLWFNELDSLGIKKNSISRDSNNRSESSSGQQLEDLIDDAKQTLIRNYKAYYSQ